MKHLLLVLFLTILNASGQVAFSSQPDLVVSEAGSSSYISTYRSSAIRVLLAPEKETILSSSAAAKIQNLYVSLGSSFVSGGVLMEFVCDEPQARTAMAQAELSAAQESHEGKVRMHGLRQASDLEVALAAAEVSKTRAQFSLAQSLVGNCEIIAPWKGRISNVFINNHMSVTPGEPLLELVKDGPLKIRLNIPSKNLASIVIGQSFTVAIDETGHNYKAEIVAINSRIDPVSQTIELEGRMVENYPGLLAGMSGTAILDIKN